MSFLLAVTTLLPDASALRTQVPAGSMPPASSTITSTSEASTESASAPNHAGRNPIDVLVGDIAIEDVREFEVLRLRFHQNPRHRTAHCAETEDGDAQRTLRGRHRRFNRRCGKTCLRHLIFLLLESITERSGDALMITEGQDSR